MGIFKRMKEDMDVIFKEDPAARTYFEVFLTYSGLHAIWNHRIAHQFYKWKLYFIARAISQFSRFLTGIEIHPGAVIGRRFFIDQGMGIVIGETCEIGDDVKVFQGVTLGGTGHDKGKRHPTVEDDVLIATGAKVLGNITLGKHSKIGGGSVVLKDVPRNATVVGIPGKVVKQDGKRVVQKSDQHITDQLQALQKEIERLNEEINSLKEVKQYVNHDL